MLSSDAEAPETQIEPTLSSFHLRMRHTLEAKLTYPLYSYSPVCKTFRLERLFRPSLAGSFPLRTP